MVRARSSLVADAAGRVLATTGLTIGVRSIELAAPYHRVGERVRLRGREAAEVHGHQERCHLLVVDVPFVYPRTSSSSSATDSIPPSRLRSISSAGWVTGERPTSWLTGACGVAGNG